MKVMAACCCPAPGKVECLWGRVGAAAVAGQPAVRDSCRPGRHGDDRLERRRPPGGGRTRTGVVAPHGRTDHGHPGGACRTSCRGDESTRHDHGDSEQRSERDPAQRTLGGRPYTSTSPDGHDLDHSMKVCLPDGPGRQLRLIVHRGRTDPEFTERERALLVLLRPHLHAAHVQVLRRGRGIPQLTNRQWELLRLVDAGLSNTQIARRLHVTEYTVRKHLENIYGRLQVSSRTAALARAFPERALASARGRSSELQAVRPYWPRQSPTGSACGVFTYVLIKVAKCKAREVPPAITHQLPVEILPLAATNALGKSPEVRSQTAYPSHRIVRTAPSGTLPRPPRC